MAERKKKLSKIVDNEAKVVRFKTVEDGVEFDYSVDDLPKEIKVKLMLHGMGCKLADAAAGKSTAEEIKAGIDKVFEALKNGEWTTRAPKATPCTKKAITEKLGELGDDEKAKALEVLAALGLNL